MALGLTQPLTEMSARNIFWGVKAAGARADKLITFMCWLSWSLGASASWKPQGLPRPVMGLLYLHFYVKDMFKFKCPNSSSKKNENRHTLTANYLHKIHTHADCQLFAQNTHTLTANYVHKIHTHADCQLFAQNTHRLTANYLHNIHTRWLPTMCTTFVFIIPSCYMFWRYILASTGSYTFVQRLVLHIWQIGIDDWQTVYIYI